MVNVAPKIQPDDDALDAAVRERVASLAPYWRSQPGCLIFWHARLASELFIGELARRGAVRGSRGRVRFGWRPQLVYVPATYRRSASIGCWHVHFARIEIAGDAFIIKYQAPDDIAAIVRHVADVATGAKALRAPLPLAEWKRTASAVWTLRLSRQLPWEPREAPTSRAA